MVSIFCFGRPDIRLRFELWRLAGRTLHADLGNAPYPLGAIAFGTANSSLKLITARYLLLGGTAIEIWDVETRSLQYVTAGLVSPPFKCQLIRAPHHRLVWADNGIEVCDMEDYSRFRIPPDRPVGTAFSVAPTPDGSSLISSSLCYDIRDEGGEIPLTSYDLPPFSTTHAPSPKYRENPSPLRGPQVGLGSVVGSASADITALKERADTVSISPDGQLAASGCSGSGDVLIWDLKARRPVIMIKGPCVDHVRSN